MRMAEIDGLHLPPRTSHQNQNQKPPRYSSTTQPRRKQGRHRTSLYEAQIVYQNTTYLDAFMLGFMQNLKNTNV